MIDIDSTSWFCESHQIFKFLVIFGTVFKASPCREDKQIRNLIHFVVLPWGADCFHPHALLPADHSDITTIVCWFCVWVLLSTIQALTFFAEVYHSLRILSSQRTLKLKKGCGEVHLVLSTGSCKSLNLKTVIDVVYLL